MTDSQVIQTFLATQDFMVVAVVLKDGSPWAIPVRTRHREGNEFEWESKIDAEHSEAIESNPKVAITMFEGMIGFYARGTAQLVSVNERGVGRYKLTATGTWMTDETFIKREVTLI